ARSTAMSEPENRCAPTDKNRDSKLADLPPEATAGDESRTAEAERVEDGETNGRPAVTPAAGSGDPRRTTGDPRRTSEQAEPALPDVSINGPTPQPPEPIGPQVDSPLKDGDRHVATGVVAGNRDVSLGASPLFQQALKGPEIPNAEVSESGV